MTTPEETEIDRLSAEVDHLDGQIQTLMRENERLRAALRDAKAWLEGEGLYDQADAIGRILGEQEANG